MSVISEITNVIKLFNTTVEGALKLSDIYVTLAFLNEATEADISNKLNEYISKLK